MAANFSEIQELLQQKADYQARLNLMLEPLRGDAVSEFKGRLGCFMLNIGSVKVKLSFSGIWWVLNDSAF